MRTVDFLKIREIVDNFSRFIAIIIGVVAMFFLGVGNGILNKTVFFTLVIGVFLLLLLIYIIIDKLDNQKKRLLKEQLKDTPLAPGTVVKIISYELGIEINPSGMKEQLILAIAQEEPFKVYKSTVKLQISELRIETIKVDMLFIRENSVATLYDYQHLPAAVLPFFSKDATGTICLVMK